jgi:hypothetical protein
LNLSSDSRGIEQFSALDINYTLNNSVTLTITPNTTVDLGTTTTASCSATYGTPVLRLNGVVVSNPHNTMLNVGTHTYNCSVAEDPENYTSAETTQSVVVTTTGSSGCWDNLTYAYKFDLTVTNNTTVIDFQEYQNDSKVRSDLGDVYVVNETLEINASRYLVINTTGQIGTGITIYFGNYPINNSWTRNAGSATPTNTITSVQDNFPFVYLTFRNEITLDVERANGTNTTLYMYCTNGMRELDFLEDSNISSLLVATYSAWEEVDTKVSYSPTVYYMRHILIQNDSSYRNLWIVDANEYQVAEMVIDLDDLTNQYANANLTIKKWIGDSLRTIDEQSFDASGMAYFYGIVGHRYQFHISCPVETRALGNVWVDLNDLSKVLTISSLLPTEEEFLGDLRFTKSYNNTTGVISLYYEDPYEATTLINFSVYDMNDTLLYYSESTADTVLFQYAVSNKSASYKVKVEVDHEVDIGEILFWWFIGAAGPVLLLQFVPQIYLTLISLSVVIGVIATTAPKNAPFGTLIAGIVAVIFMGLGWLNIPAALVVVVIALAVLWMLRQEAETL